MRARSGGFNAVAVGLMMLASASSAAVWAQPAEPSAAELEVIEKLKALPPDSSPQAQLVAVDQALARLSAPTPLRGQLLCTKGTILVGLRELPEAQEALIRCQQLLPDEPDVLRSLIWVSEERDRPAETARYLISLAEFGQPETAIFDGGMLRSLSRRLRYAREYELDRRLSAALVKHGWYRDDPRLFSAMAEEVVRARLQDNDLHGALSLLPEITTPSVGMAMLLDRNYQAIWPQIEAWAGQDMSAQRTATVRAAKAAYDADRSAENRLTYLSSLIETGRRQEGLDGFSAWLGEPGDVDEGLERSLAVTRYGRELAADGQSDLAFAAMRRALRELAPEWQLNVVPNLAVLLILDERSDEAVELLARYSPEDGDLEAAAANGYFYALRACAAKRSGKDAVAAQVYEAQVLSTYANNAGAMNILTACFANDERLANFWKGRLADPETRQGTIVTLATVRFRNAHSLPAASVQDQALRRIHARDDLQTEYQKYARTMPAEYEAVLNDFAPVHGKRMQSKAASQP